MTRKFFGTYILPVIFNFSRGVWFFTRPHKVGAKVVITSGEKILFIKHNYGRRTWTFPGGGVKKNEEPKGAVVREAREEVGVKLKNPVFLGILNTVDEFKKVTIHIYTENISNTKFKKDDLELSEAKWIGKRKIPKLGPNAIHILDLYLQWKKSN